MSERIKEKIEQISSFLEELEKAKPSNFEEYENNVVKRLACERACEKIIEAATDLVFLVFKEEILARDKNISIPKDDTDVFKTLAEKKIIGEQLSKKLVEAKGMRNHLAHKYGEINNKIVFDAVEDNLKVDINELIDSIERVLNKKVIKDGT